MVDGAFADAVIALGQKAEFTDDFGFLGDELQDVAAHALQLTGGNAHLDVHSFEEHFGLTRRSVLQ